MVGVCGAGSCERIKPDLPKIPEHPEITDYSRPPREEFRYVPDAAAKLEERCVESSEGKKKKKKHKH